MRHLLATVRLKPQLINDERAIYNYILLAANKAGATVLGSIKHEFSPRGLTAIVVLAESHISIHTYPENGLIYFDAFTCGKVSPATILLEFCKLINGRVISKKMVRRASTG